jgi:hypothetical protein
MGIIWVGTLLFLLFITLPALDSVFDLAPEVNLMESETPALSPFVPGKLFETWSKLQRGALEKKFGFRSLLVRLQNIFDVLWLRSTPSNQSVVVGKEDWLFLAQENKDLNVVEDYRATTLFTPPQLARWVKEYEGRRDWLAARGIRYLVLVAPNKLSVYPEYLAEIYNKVHQYNRTDQLVDALNKAGVDILDLRPVLIRAKVLSQGKDKLYYHTDAHWTPLGAYVGYVALMERLRAWYPNLTAVPRDELVIDFPLEFRGELALMLALSDKYPEMKQTVTTKTPRRAVKVPSAQYGPRYFQSSLLMETGDASLPRAVVFRDSFSEALYPFLSEHFSRILYLWPYPSTPRGRRYFDRKAVEEEKPDLVVDAFVERYFTVPPAESTP